MAKKMYDIVWPVRLVATPTMGETRFVIEDSYNDRVGVLYNFDAKVADKIIRGLNNFGNQWTDAEISLLIKHWCNGIPRLNICRELGRSEDSVEDRLQQYFGTDYRDFHACHHKPAKYAELETAIFELLAKLEALNL